MSEMFAPLSEEELSAEIPQQEAKPRKQPIVPVPDDAPPMRFRHPEHGAPSKSWAYHNTQGQLVVESHEVVPVQACSADW